jgi:SAM-dependent methyltransferase
MAELMSATALVQAPFPIRLGSDEEFSRLRKLLSHADFVQENMEGHFLLRHLGEAEFAVEARKEDMPGPFRTLASLFLQGKSLDPDEFCRTLGDELARLLDNLGLVQKENGRIVATVAMYATNGLYIVSDRWCGVDGQKYEPPADVVYPAVLGTTRGYLGAIPATPCKSFLELCSGTGIAALLAAGYGAEHAWAFDIAERSVHFAEFNRRLNGIPNVTNACGDLYSPGRGRKFDRIVGHPPYVPVLEPKYIFYDGGQDGEQITRRMVEELPQYLDSGGLFICVSLGTDRLNDPFEARIRRWLGDKHDEFDVALFVRSEMDPAVQAFNDVVRRRGNVDQVQRWREVLTKLQIVSFVFGNMFIRRHSENRAGYTIRRTMAKNSGLKEIESIMDWERSVARGENTEILRDTCLKVVPQCRLSATYVLREGNWTPERQRLQVDEPFKMELEAPGWTLQLLELCDGTRSGEDLFGIFKANEALEPETTFHQFADVLSLLVSGGWLSLVH